MLNNDAVLTEEVT